MMSSSRGSRVGAILGLIGALSAGLVVMPTNGTAQELGQASGLELVERLVAMGRAEEARQALMVWWGEDRREASRSDLQRGLWLRGRLTVDPAQASLDFQRLAVLYPGGTYSDRALLRLAQAAHSLGDAEMARHHIAALGRDYPNSRVRGDAEAWLAAAGPPPPPPTQPDGRTEEAVAGAQEAEASEASVSEEADRGPAGEETEAGRPVAEEASAGEVASPAREFSVQLGAFGELGRARAVLESATAEALDARLVRVEGSGLFHVRVGSFADRSAAQELLDRVADAGIIGAVVRDARPEEPVTP